jgi:hemerythrin-like metal-binding protein
MEQFVWKDSFALGIEEIDLQHRKLLGYLNECMYFGAAKRDDVDIRGLLDELRSYASSHFAAEEKLMRDINFPGLEAHLKQHQLFNDQVAELERTAGSGQKQGASSLGAFLRDWYLQHILEQDKRYAAYTTRG